MNIFFADSNSNPQFIVSLSECALRLTEDGDKVGLFPFLISSIHIFYVNELFCLNGSIR